LIFPRENQFLLPYGHENYRLVGGAFTADAANQNASVRPQSPYCHMFPFFVIFSTLRLLKKQSLLLLNHLLTLVKTREAGVFLSNFLNVVPIADAIGTTFKKLRKLIFSTLRLLKNNPCSLAVAKIDMMRSKLDPILLLH